MYAGPWSTACKPSAIRDGQMASPAPFGDRWIPPFPRRGNPNQTRPRAYPWEGRVAQPAGSRHYCSAAILAATAGRMPAILRKAGRMPAIQQSPAGSRHYCSAAILAATAGRMPAILRKAGRMPAVLRNAGRMPAVQKSPAGSRHYSSAAILAATAGRMPAVLRKAGGMPAAHRKAGRMPAVLRKAGRMPAEGHVQMTCDRGATEGRYRLRAVATPC